MWKLSNISKSLPNEVWENIFNNSKFLTNVCMVVSIIPIAYLTIHFILSKYVGPYQRLGDPLHMNSPSSTSMKNDGSRRSSSTGDAQIVVLHHTIEFIILSCLFPPMTYMVMSILFEEQSLDNFERKVLRLVVMISVILVFNYLFELASRYKQPRPILILHHLIAYGDGVFLLIFQTTANIKTAMILSYFIVFEAMTFAGLVCYRLFPFNRYTPKIILSGIVLMGLSRPLQVILILSFIISAWDDLVKWHAIVQIVVTVVLTLIQFWTLKIHYNMWKRCHGKVLERNLSMMTTKEDGISFYSSHTQQQQQANEGGDIVEVVEEESFSDDDGVVVNNTA